MAVLCPDACMARLDQLSPFIIAGPLHERPSRCALQQRQRRPGTGVSHDGLLHGTLCLCVLTLLVYVPVLMHVEPSTPTSDLSLRD